MTQIHDDSNIDLSKLEDTYEILSTLHHDSASTTYLARHRELGRDVTISVVHMPGGGENNTLTHFASDARLLATSRHESIVPVLEGRWLDDDTFAVARVLARGSSLAKAVQEKGQFSLPRVAETLEQVHQGLQWARESGVIHRNVTADSVGYQQGSGRVMMSLGLATLPMDSLPDACSDCRTIGALAWTMLAGRSYDAATTDDKTLAELRPGLSPEVISETEALLACENGGETRDIAAYIAMLRTAKEVLPPPTVAPAAIAPRQPWVAAVERAPAVPVGSPAPADQPVIVRSRFRSPITAALVVAVLIVVAAIAFLRWRSADRSQVASGDIDRTQVASGDRTSPMEAAPPPLPAGSARPPAPTVDSSLIMSRPVPMTATPYPTPMPSTAMQPTPPSAVASSTPLTARPTPVVTPPDTTVPKPVRDTVPSNPDDPCNSDNGGDQRACFNAAIAKQDVELNRVYGDVIAAMRRRANVGDTDPDPESVRKLRAAQRQWVAERDTECRRRGEGREGARWAQSRAACFSELSAERTRQLAQMRDTP
jgi:uncharacterized protein YecT (DUF1311 family)